MCVCVFKFTIEFLRSHLIRLVGFAKYSNFKRNEKQFFLNNLCKFNRMNRDETYTHSISSENSLKSSINMWSCIVRDTIFTFFFRLLRFCVVQMFIDGRNFRCNMYEAWARWTVSSYVLYTKYANFPSRLWIQ